MSWFERINAAILRRIAPRDPVVADEQGIEQSGQRFAYADLQRAVAYRHPSLVADDLAVLLDFGEGRIVGVNENDEAWRAILTALDANPRSRQRSAVWTLELATGPEDIRLELLD